MWRALWYVVVLQGGAETAQRNIEELYYGYEGKSGILDEVMKDFFENGCGNDYDEKTWLEMLIVKHALIMAERIKKEGDFVSGITDAEPPFCYSDVKLESF